MGYYGDERDYQISTQAENIETERFVNQIPYKGSEKKKENPDYMAKESLVYKKRFAPKGFVFLIVTHQENRKIYTSCLMVAGGLTTQQKQTICLGMWENIKEKYSLKGSIKPNS